MLICIAATCWVLCLNYDLTHVLGSVKETFWRVGTKLLVILRRMTKSLELLDVVINPHLKSIVHKQWEKWMLEVQHEYTARSKLLCAPIVKACFGVLSA